MKKYKALKKQFHNKLLSQNFHKTISSALGNICKYFAPPVWTVLILEWHILHQTILNDIIYFLMVSSCTHFEYSVEFLLNPLRSKAYYSLRLIIQWVHGKQWWQSNPSVRQMYEMEAWSRGHWAIHLGKVLLRKLNPEIMLKHRLYVNVLFHLFIH